MLEHPVRLLLIATLLLLFGCTMPFLMVIKVVESTFFMNFLSYGASVAGLFLGIIGIATQRFKTDKKKDQDFYE
jgi:hypothetical protein